MVERLGEIKIADQVVAVIAGAAAAEVPGVSVLAGSLYQSWTKKISGGAKGISVTISENTITIEMRISVEYGQLIHQVCRQLQEKVKAMVEALTGLLVEAVHVRVEGIVLK